MALRFLFNRFEKNNFMKKIFLLLLFVIVPFATQANAQSYEDDLDGLLSDFVAPTTKDGIEYHGVDYDAWGKDPRHAKVRDAILAMDPDSLSTKEEKLAYWINAYNVLTIDLITRTGEQKSIKNLGNFLNSPWDKYKWEIAGKQYSLNNIEHDTIRKIDEPRIHFAVNCAAKSCPDLRAEAFRASELDQQLEEQANLTLNNETKGFKKESGDAVRVTKIMDWYGEDFDKGDLTEWLTAYKPEVVDAGTKVRFFKYDWSLNEL